MLIIIEGPDQVGKTTLAHEFDVPVRHAGQPRSHPLLEYVRSLEMENTEELVLDRWHLGQAVYPYLYPDGRVPLTHVEQAWMDMYFASRGAILVHLTVDPFEVPALIHRLEDDPNSYLQPQDAERCVALFESAARRSGPFYRYGVNRLEFPIDLKRIPYQLERMARQARLMVDPVLRDFPYVIGRTINPRLLLVGDRRGRPNPPEADHALPFAPYGGSSGRYLLETLLGNPQLLASAAITNAHDPDGTARDVEELWLRLGKPPVVALGTNVRACLAATGIPFGVVPHPQYVRRFHHDRQAEYLAAIEYIEHAYDADASGWFK